MPDSCPVKHGKRRLKLGGVFYAQYCGAGCLILDSSKMHGCPIHRSCIAMGGMQIRAPSSRPERAAYTCHPDRSAQPIPVIPTGATDGLIVRCAVEAPPAFRRCPCRSRSFLFVILSTAKNPRIGLCSCRCLFLPLSVLAVARPCRCLFSALPEGAGGFSPLNNPRRIKGLQPRAFFFAPPPSKTPANPLVKPLDAPKSP